VKLACWGVVLFGGQEASGRPGGWPPTGVVGCASFGVLRSLLCCVSRCSASLPVLRQFVFYDLCRVPSLHQLYSVKYTQIIDYKSVICVKSAYEH
jgi:hypothetical protein